MSLSRSLSSLPQLPARFGATSMWLLLAAALLLLSSPRAEGANGIEYQVKAGFLFNFAKFIDWPTGSLAAGEELRLGVVGSDEVFGIIERSLAGKTVGERRLVVERLDTSFIAANARLPHLVFIQHENSREQSDPGLTQRLTAALDGHPVLVVGESPAFATSGGMIGFIQRGENLRFQVNLTNAQRAGLKLSARLSGLAEIVRTPSR